MDFLLARDLIRASPAGILAMFRSYFPPYAAKSTERQPNGLRNNRDPAGRVNSGAYSRQRSLLRWLESILFGHPSPIQHGGGCARRQQIRRRCCKVLGRGLGGSV